MQATNILFEAIPLRIIGVVGNSGSGKSTVADHLKTELGAKVISLDNYYKGLPEGVLAEDYNFDHPDAIDWELLKEHLSLLARGIGIFINTYNFEKHCRNSHGSLVELRSNDWLVLEGTMVCAKAEIANMLNHVIYVGASLDKCFARRVLRDASRGRTPEMVRKRWERDVVPFYWNWLKPIEEKKYDWCSKVFLLNNNTNFNLFESLDIIISLWTGKH